MNERAYGSCAASVFLHLITGGDDSRASFQGAQERVLGTLARPASADLELTWLGTMAMFQVGGEAWKHWNGGPLKRLGAVQDDAGRFASEDANGVSSTALACLALEARYRYTRLMGR